MTTLFQSFLRFLFFCGLSINTTIVFSETTLKQDDIYSATPESINAERLNVTKNAALSEQQRNELFVKLDESSRLLQESKHQNDNYSLLQNEVTQAPKLVQQIEKKIPGKELIKDSVISSYNRDQLSALLDDYRAELELTRNNLEQQEKLLADYILFAKKGGAEIADIEERVNRLRLTDVAKSQNSIDHLFSSAKLQQNNSTLALLKIKRKNLDVLTGLATVRRDYFSREAALLQQSIDQIHTQIQLKAEQKIQTSQTIEEKKPEQLAPELKLLQDKINDLVQEQNELLADSSTRSRRLDTVKKLLDELQADQTRVQQVIKLAGDSEQISTLLQKRRAQIPSVSFLTEEVIAYQGSMSEAVLRQLSLDEILREYRTKKIAAVATSTPRDDKTENAAKLLREKHQDIIQDLLKKYNTYIAQLSTLDATTHQLLAVALDYRNFIDERLLWMPSSGLIAIFQPANLFKASLWLINPDNVELLLENSLQAIKSHKLQFAVFILVLIGLLLFRRRALITLKNTASKTRKVSTDSFSATILATISTVVLTLPVPLLMIGYGLLLSTAVNAREYTIAVAAGLQGSGMLLLILIFFKELCRQTGLSSNHLRWQATLCEQLKNEVVWLTPFVIPLAFLFSINAAGVSSSFIYLSSYIKINEPGVYTLGQISFIVLMLIMLLFIYRIWRKNGPVMNKLAETTSKAGWAQYHALWFAPLMMIPAGFALASILGYDYTVTYLVAKSAQTLWIILALVLLKDILLRSLYVTQRRLKLEETLKARQELIRQKKDLSEDSITPSANPVPLDDEKIQYGELSHQVNNLLRTIFITSILIGLWWIWKDVIPALNILNTIELPMTTSVILDGVSKEIPLTLGDLLVGLILGTLTLLAARSVPGLMDITLLNRLPISQASRYAITTMSQYFVAAMGIIISFKALGLQWSNIQWLVAALSVGLGFGLQEIVANFVSGIILLFEQPIRVGDVVTVEGTTGTVTRIRIRATTIVNWEKQELIVPNKTFITGQLVNWTLSDTVNRVIISVGVAYGSDTVKAMKIMSEIAEENQQILLDPAPRITFEEFGDNSLNLKLRIYLNDIDLRLPTITELHQQINDKFKEAGIVIAFPQRDLHIDTTQPLELVMLDKKEK